MKINKCTDLNVNQGILDDGIIKWTTTFENYWHCLLKPKTQDGLAGEGVSCQDWPPGATRQKEHKLHYLSSDFHKQPPTHTRTKQTKKKNFS